MEHMKTQSEVIAELQGEGYNLNLWIDEGGRIVGDDHGWDVQDVSVEVVHRFEGMSNPDDLAILLGVVGPGDERGLVSLPYGPDVSGDQADTIRALTLDRPEDHQ